MAAKRPGLAQALGIMKKHLLALALATCAPCGAVSPDYSALSTRVAAGDVQAFHQALALAKERPEPRKLAELADMISKFVTINPEEFLRAQLAPYPDKFSAPCFAVDYFGPDYFMDSAAEAVEAGRRGYELSSVDSPELSPVKELCLAKLNAHDA